MGRQPVASLLHLTEMKGSLPVPARQHGLEDIILRLKKKPFQFLLQTIRNAVHGKSSTIESDFLSSDDLPS
jgi:hypothetical protein